MDPKMLPIQVASTIIIIKIERFIAKTQVDAVVEKVNVSFQENVPEPAWFFLIFFELKQ
jgi:hypothetical protein